MAVQKLAVVGTATPSAAVVRLLEEALARVRAGETFGILLLEQDAIGGCSYHCEGLKNRFELTGYLTHAIHQLQSD